MVVTFEAFYKLFMKSNPEIRYTPQDKEKGHTLDNICSDSLVMKAPRARDATLEQVKQAIREGTSFAIGDSRLGNDIDASVIFLCAVGTRSKHHYEVQYLKDVTQYFK